MAQLIGEKDSERVNQEKSGLSLRLIYCNLKAFKILLQPGDLLSISSYSLKIRSRLVTDLLFPYLQDHDFFAKRFSINEFQISFFF